MKYQFLLYGKEDGIGIVTINRPESLNPLSGAVYAELGKLFQEIEDDPEVHVAILTGSGERAFVAGADIADMQPQSSVGIRGFIDKARRASDRVSSLSKPVIAAINGFALGGGCELAMACHIRVASSNAVFGQPEVKLGLIPGYAGTQRLPRLVGRGRALEILLSGRNVSAEEAERMGLVNSVCDPAELEDTVNSLLAKILANGPLAVSHCIEAVNHGLDLPFDDACLLEATLFGVGAASEEMREGTSAFLEKRKASFRS